MGNPLLCLLRVHQRFTGRLGLYWERAIAITLTVWSSRWTGSASGERVLDWGQHDTENVTQMTFWDCKDSNDY